MAFAHSKNVIHRDLKPANLMVGRFGEVYVMDWGLARVLGQTETRDLRIRREPADPQSVLDTDRRKDDDSPLLTMDGQVLGTPAYMSPEQARGELERMGPASDVYSIGAILYHLLTNRMPFVPEGARVSPMMVLAWVLEGELQPIHKAAPTAPPELVSICEKAMSREPEDRYADVEALAEDLRRYLEGRVVLAHRTGPVVELTKWLLRNKAASLILILAMIGLGAASANAIVQRRHRAALERSEKRALDSEAEARRQRYIAKIHTARSRLGLGDQRGGMAILDSCQEDLRDVEWYHLKHLADRSVLTLTGHEGHIVGLAFSADGKHLLSAAHDGAICKWNAATGELLKKVDTGDGKIVCFASTESGDRLATGSETGLISLWDPETLDRQLSLRSDGKGVTALCFVPDGERLVSSSQRGRVGMTLWLWDLGSGSIIRNLEHESRLPMVHRLAADHQQPGVYILRSFSRRVDRWDLNSNVIAPTKRNAAHDNVSIQSVRSTGQVLVGGEGLAVVNNLETGSAQELHGSFGKALSLSASDKSILIGCEDGTIREFSNFYIWNLPTFHLGHEWPVTCLQFSPDGSVFASGSSDSTIKLWTPHVHWDSGPIWGGTLQNIRMLPVTGAMDVSSDGKTVVACSHEVVELYNLSTGETVRLKRPVGQDSEDTCRVSFAQRREGVCTFSFGDQVFYWNTKAGPPEPILESMPAELPAEGREVQRLAISPGGERIVWCTASNHLIAWQPHEDEEPTVVDQLAYTPTTRIELSGNGDVAVLGDIDGSLHFYDLLSGEVWVESKAHQGYVSAIEFASDGSLWTSSNAGTLRHWLPTGDGFRMQDTLDAGHNVFGLALSRSGRRAILLTGATPTIIDLESGDRLMEWSAVPKQRMRTLYRTPVGQYIRGWSREFGEGIPPTTPGQSGSPGVRVGPAGSFVTFGDPFYYPTTSSFPPAGRAQSEQIDHLVAKFKDMCLTKSELIDHVRLDAEIAPKTMEAVVRAIRASAPNAGAMNSESWRIAKLEDANSEDYRRALKLAEDAVETAPFDPNYRNTLGLALLRCGKWDKALRALRIADNVRRNAGGSGDPANLALMAWAIHALGDKAEARSKLQRAVERSTNGDWSERYLEETRELIKLVCGQIGVDPGSLK